MLTCGEDGGAYQAEVCVEIQHGDRMHGVYGKGRQRHVPDARHEGAEENHTGGAAGGHRRGVQ